MAMIEEIIESNVVWMAKAVSAFTTELGGGGEITEARVLLASQYQRIVEIQKTYIQTLGQLQEQIMAENRRAANGKHLTRLTNILEPMGQFQLPKSEKV